MRRIFTAFFAAAAVSAVAFSSRAPPKFPDQHYVSGTISLPYIDLVMPFSSWLDAPNKRQRIDYFNGMDSNIVRGDLKHMWAVFPVFEKQWCIQSSSVALTPVLPDATGFSFIGTTKKSGHLADHWRHIVMNYNRTNTYDYYLHVNTTVPLQLHMLGYDYVLDSHYDEYVIDYTTYVPGKTWINATVFAQPQKDCTGYYPSGEAADDDYYYDDDGGGGPSRRMPLVPNPFSHFRRAMPPRSGGFVLPPSSACEPSAEQPEACKFQLYMAEHGKQYDSEEELRQRQVLFHRNVQFIEETNRRHMREGRSLRLAVNHLADMTPDELAFYKGVGHQRGRRGVRQGGPGWAGTHPPPTPALRKALPQEVNWVEKGAVLPVKDQGVCGSCWSFGAVSALEGQVFLKHRKLAALSQQALVDCSWYFGNNGCDGGLDYLGYEWIMGNGGLPTVQSYGQYLSQNGKCHNNVPGVVQGVQVRSYKNVTEGSEEALMDALANVGPISISIDASLDSFSFYRSGIFDDPTCKSGMDDLDHTVTAVGYGSENGVDYWLVKNSWSTHWGDKGYVKIARKGNICGVATQPTYPIIK